MKLLNIIGNTAFEIIFFSFAGKTKGTPGRGSKTLQAADRFIPNRSATNFDLSHHLLTTQVLKSECTYQYTTNDLNW